MDYASLNHHTTPSQHPHNNDEDSLEFDNHFQSHPKLIKESSTSKLLISTLSPPPPIPNKRFTSTLNSNLFNSSAEFFPSFADFLPPIDFDSPPPPPSSSRVQQQYQVRTQRGRDEEDDEEDVGEERVGLGIVYKVKDATKSKPIIRDDDESYTRFQPYHLSSSTSSSSINDSFTFFPSPSFHSTKSSPNSTQYPSPISRSSPSTRLNQYSSFDRVDIIPVTPPRSYHPSQQSRSISSAASVLPPSPVSNSLCRSNSNGFQRSLSSLSPVFVPNTSARSSPSTLPASTEVDRSRTDVGERIGGKYNKEEEHVENHTTTVETIELSSAEAFEAAATVLSRRDIELVAHLHGGRIPSLAQLLPPDPAESSVGVNGQPEIVNTGNQVSPMIVQVGDWQCGVCTFVNWRRRKICMRCFPFANDIGKLLTINSQKAATLAFPLTSTPPPPSHSTPPRFLPSSQSAPQLVLRPLNPSASSSASIVVEPLPSHARRLSSASHSHTTMMITEEDSIGYGARLQRVVHESSPSPPSYTSGGLRRRAYADHDRGLVFESSPFRILPTTTNTTMMTAPQRYSTPSSSYPPIIPQLQPQSQSHRYPMITPVSGGGGGNHPHWVHYQNYIVDTDMSRSHSAPNAMNRLASLQSSSSFDNHTTTTAASTGRNTMVGEEEVPVQRREMMLERLGDGVMRRRQFP